MTRMSALATLLITAAVCGAEAQFALQDDGARLTVLEGDKPVLVYNYRRVAPPKGVAEHYGRACYIHPLYGLDGDVLTQDFPPDHYHHRGLYWAWPMCKVGDRRADIWLSKDVHQHFEKWLMREVGKDQAEIGVQNVWTFDDRPDNPVVRETIRFTVRPADEQGRTVDFHLEFTNLTDEALRIEPKDYKGYGGFCLRLDAKRKPLTFTTALGTQPPGEDALRCETPWADVSSRIEPDGPYSGAAMFQHRENPGYPHPGWILRHYGFLGASWPHVETREIGPGRSFALRYRLYIHRGDAEQGDVRRRFQEYRNGL